MNKNPLKNLTISVITGFLILILSTTNSLAMTSNNNSPQIKTPFETDLNNGRDFSVLSFNKDGSELMFNECFYYQDEANQKKKYPEGECRIFRLNLTNNTLRHYDLPEKDKYTYTDGSFSPNGNYVVMKRAPKNKYDEKLSDKENEGLVSQNYEKAEIAIMNNDGTNFKIIKTTPGIKARPIMSNDEMKIAYFRGELRRSGSKTFAANFDLWEIDLKNKTDKLFAGPYEFYGIGQNVQYLKGDGEIIADVDGSKNGRKGLNTSEYSRRYSNSSIYTIRRGENELPEPMLIDGVEHQRSPLYTKKGTMFFYGVETKTGFRLFKKTKESQLTKWKPLVEFGQKVQILPTPDEEKIFFVYRVRSVSKTTSTRSDKSGIAFLDTASSNWQKLDVATISSSTAIHVADSGLIDTKPSERNIFDFSLSTTITKTKR